MFDNGKQAQSTGNGGDNGGCRRDVEASHIHPGGHRNSRSVTFLLKKRYVETSITEREDLA